MLKARLDLEHQVKYTEEAVHIEHESILLDKVFEDRYIQDNQPTERELTEVLRAMGKYTRQDELNCGACGYATCRAKAEAVYQGKAEIMYVSATRSGTG